MTIPLRAGYAPVNGLEMYWESRGAGGVPLIVTHGGFGLISQMTAVLDRLAERRQVVAVELQGHGHTPDIDRPFTYEAFGDDLAALARHLDLGPVDLLGYSLGGGASLRATIQHPDLVRRLVLVSAPFRRDAWFPEIRAAFDGMGRSGFEALRPTPLYAAWQEVAPGDEDAFLTLMDRTGELQRRPYDWADEVRTITAPVLLVFGDSDSVAPSHPAEFFSLLGGGQRDGGWTGDLPTASRLAILPATTHYDVFSAPLTAGIVADFLA
jgi:pimeloyl-ACP methyl ester carboxylesterase